MKITIKELMQLKNEVAQTIHNMNPGTTHGFGAKRVAYGNTFIDDRKIIDSTADIPEFPDYYERLALLLEYSNTLNTALARANVDHGIGDAVRHRENLKMLIRVNEAALQHSKPYSQEESMLVAGGGKERVHKRYEPYENSSTLKSRIRVLKQRTRELQTLIDEGNTQRVEIDGVDREAVEALLDA